MLERNIESKNSRELVCGLIRFSSGQSARSITEQNKRCAAAAVMRVHRLQCRLSEICRESADRQLWSP